MPTNKWTQGTPLAGATTRAVLAERAYIAPSNTAYADPGAKLDGADPAAPWADMGLVKDSKVSLSYTKEVKAVETGIEKVRRGSYTLSKKCSASFSLEQFDLDTLALTSGLSSIAVGGIGGKIHLGQDDVIEKALLFLGTNKVDGKEYHHYTKKASISYSIVDDAEARNLKVDADFYSFLPSGETVEAFVTVYVLD